MKKLIKKITKKEVKKPEVFHQQRYVALRNIDRYKRDGWRIVPEVKPASDLVLMEKK